jgi:hypothetical protein
MDHSDSQAFAILLAEHRQLWVSYQVLKYLTENPSEDEDEVRERFSEKALAVYQPLENALLQGQPVLTLLQDALQKQ